jgi:hypothetical protein
MQEKIDIIKIAKDNLESIKENIEKLKKEIKEEELNRH